MSNRLCQDPLENFFGEQRQRGRVNENLNAQELMNTQALHVVNGFCQLEAIVGELVQLILKLRKIIVGHYQSASTNTK